MYSSILSLTLALDGGGWSTPRPGRFNPGNNPAPIVKEAGWVPRTVWKGAENLAPTGIQSPDPPARSSCYTNCVIYIYIYIYIYICVCIYIYISLWQPEYTALSATLPIHVFSTNNSHNKTGWSPISISDLPICKSSNVQDVTFSQQREDSSLLEYDAVPIGKPLPTFRRSLLPPHLGSTHRPCSSSFT